MVREIALELIETVDAAGVKLREIEDADAAKTPAPGKWSKKEILGHLIDSATNNHHRFVRAQQVEALTFPPYHPDYWVAAACYESSDWIDLIALWRLYNRQLARVIERIPPTKLGTLCQIEAGSPVTQEFLVMDYLTHMRHHLRQLEEG